MAKASTTGKKGAKKIGRHKRKPANQRYAAQDRRTDNKKKRILQSNGERFLKQWLSNRFRGRHAQES